MARKNDGACGNTKQIRTDVDCRAARPKFDNGAWSPAKISDVTGRGLYLFVTPDESRPRNAASKHLADGLRVGYVKERFGKLHRQDIKRPDVLAFMRSYEAEGKLETRDRVRSIGEQICNYADVEGDGYNPFRNLNGQMIANISTPRPGVTEPRDVTRVFKLISAPWTRARFSDVVGLALRFDALTIPRPGMVNEMEAAQIKSPVGKKVGARALLLAALVPPQAGPAFRRGISR
jgi:integrase